MGVPVGYHTLSPEQQAWASAGYADAASKLAALSEISEIVGLCGEVDDVERIIQAVRDSIEANHG